MHHILPYSFGYVEVRHRVTHCLVQEPLAGHGLLFIEASKSRSDTLNPNGLLCTSDQPNAETSTWQHTTLTTDIHVAVGIRTRNRSKQAAADTRLRQRGH